MATSWRAVSVPTQKSNGDLPRGPGVVTPSPGRAESAAVTTQVGGPGGLVGRRPSTGLLNHAELTAGATTPDHVSFAGTASGIEIIAHVWMKTWTPSVTHWFVAQGDHVFNLDLAWALTIHPNRKLRTAVSTDGTAIIGPESTGSVPFLPGEEGWIRTQVFPNFLGARFFVYWWSRNGIDWVDIGNINDGAPITIFDSAATVSIPGIHSELNCGQVTFEVKVLNAILTPPIGTLVWPRFDTLPPRQPSFIDDARKTWTIVEPALIGVV